MNAGLWGEGNISMKTWRCQRRKLNNTGVSLVEIVVAMFLLAIVTVSVLTVLVYSIRLNSRSRTRQQTTAAAQTVMENFKAYSVRELCEQFNGIQENIGGVDTVKSFSVSGTTVTTQIVRLLGSAMGATPTPDVLAPNDSAAIDALLKSKDDINFQVRDMEYQNEYFDVEIQLRRHEGSHTADMQTLIYENPTEGDSAAYIGDVGMDAAALMGIADKVAEAWTIHESATPLPGATPGPDHSGSEVDLSQIHITRRELTATVRQDGGDYVVEMGCKYWYKVDSYSYVDDSGATQTFNIPETEYSHMMDTSDPANLQPLKEIFRKPIAAANSINLIMYYYPAYHDVGSLRVAVSIDEDNLVIKNDLPVPLGGMRPEVKCYLYKQRNLTLSDSRVSTLEQNCGPNFHLTLGDRVYIYDDNLDTILGDPNATYTYPVGNITPTENRANRYRGISYAAQKANTSGPGATPVPVLPTELEADKTVETVRLMYDITVLVYRQDDLIDSGPKAGATPLTVLSGTLIE